jgi:hypothetical protein
LSASAGLADSSLADFLPVSFSTADFAGRSGFSVAGFAGLAGAATAGAVAVSASRQRPASGAEGVGRGTRVAYQGAYT